MKCCCLQELPADIMRTMSGPMKCCFLQALPADTMRTLSGPDEMLLFTSTSYRQNENSARPRWNVAFCKHFLQTWEHCQAQIKCCCLQALPADTMIILPGPDEMLMFASTSCRHNENSARHRWNVAVCKTSCKNKENSVRFWWNVVVCKHFLQT